MLQGIETKSESKYSKHLKSGRPKMEKRQNWDSKSVPISDSDHATSPIFATSLDCFIKKHVLYRKWSRLA